MSTPRSVTALRCFVCVLAITAAAEAQARWQLEHDLSSRRGFAMAFDAARGQTVLFGGFDGAERDETWVWDGATWQLLQPSVRPTPRSYAAMAWDSIRQRVVLFGGNSGGTDQTDLWAWDGSTWNQLLPSTAVVPSTSLRFLVHDPIRDRLVLLSITGNFVAVAESDGSTWTNVTPVAPWPPHSFSAAVTFDPVTARTTYLPIGKPTAALWRWNGTTWTSQTVTGGANQHTARLVHDPVTSRLLLAGGTNFSDANTLFGLNPAGTAWLLLASSGPRAREGGACFDTLRNRLVFVGGTAVGTPVDSSVWEWDGGPWLRRTNAPPGGRHSLTVAHDPGNDRIWLFGGSASGEWVGDLWSHDAIGWQVQWRQDPSAPAPINPGTTLGRRLVYDDARQQLLLMAGETSTFQFWRWTGTAWSPIGGAVPPPRSHPGVVFDRRRGRVVMFGGRVSALQSQVLNDTWTYDGVAWSQLFPATAPPARYEPGIAYDPLRDRVVMNGGNGLQALGETWEFDGADWHQFAGGSLFPGVSAPALAYDAERQITVAVTPATTTTGTLRTWQWDGAVWSETFPGTPPLSRGLPALLPTNAGVLSFGGSVFVSSVVYPPDQRWLRTPAPASVQSFGAPGTSIAGPFVLAVPGAGPWLGDRVVMAITGVPPISLPGLWAGGSRTTWGGLPLPLDLGPLGWPGTMVRIAPEIPVPVLNAQNGTASAAIDLPPSPTLVGVELYLQALVFEPLSGALTSSNGLTFVAGLR